MQNIETIRPLFMLIIYLVIFIAQLILLVKAIKTKKTKSWLKLFLLEICSIIISIALWQYFENLPGYGFMPGLSYLGETLYSFGSTILSLIMLIITTCAKIIIYIKNHNTNNTI